MRFFFRYNHLSLETLMPEIEKKCVKSILSQFLSGASGNSACMVPEFAGHTALNCQVQIRRVKYLT